MSNPTPRGGYAAPRPAEGAGDAINLDDFYATMEQVPPGTQAGMGPLPPPPPPEWTPPERMERPERPIIRPQSAGPTSAPLTRRAPSQVQSPRSGDELGVEESEFDKPTYLRRGLYAPE